jgi:hypothetical protein
MKENRDALENIGKKAVTVRSGDVFSSDEFAQNLDRTFTHYGYAPLERPLSDLVFLCGLSLLQGNSVKVKRLFGKFSLAIMEGSLQLEVTTSILFQGKKSIVVYPVASVVNRWIPICNPRARVVVQSPIRVTVANFSPLIEGFTPFEAHIERNPPIALDEVRALAAQLGLREEGVEFIYEPANGSPMPLRYDGQRLTVPGLPEYFKPGSDYEKLLKATRQRLRACVHDDGGAHWFLEGLEIAPDGFHSHFVGRGPATCTRPAKAPLRSL